MTKLEEAKDICTRLLLVPFEGYHARLPNGDCRAYPDPATGGAPWTIGYGSTFHPDGTPVQPLEVWTATYALEAKKSVLNSFLGALLKLSPSLVTANPSQIAAVLSWVYNCGLGNYRVSTFKKKVDQQQWYEAAEQCKKWNKANGKVMRGLTRRREAEANLLIS